MTDLSNSGMKEGDCLVEVKVDVDEVDEEEGVEGGLSGWNYSENSRRRNSPWEEE